MGESILNIGIAGTGIIMRDYHLPVVMNTPGVRLAAIGNKHPDSMNRLARQYHIDRQYTDFNEMAADPDLDCIINGLPNYLHAPVTIAMLEAGKHVLCEKPMAMNLKEAGQMREAARNSGRHMMVAHMWRFDREIQWLKSIIQSGLIGTVCSIEAYAVSIGEGPDPEGWFTKRSYAGGGVLADMGVHAVDTIQYLFNDDIKPAQVYCRNATRYSDIELEDTSMLMIEYDNGVCASIVSGWYHPYADGPEGALRIYGTQGFASVFPTMLYAPLSGVTGNFYPKFPERNPHCDMHMYEAQFAYFIDRVRDEKSPLMDGAHAETSMSIIDAGYESHEKNSVIHMPGV